jgi:TolB-like protein/tetratricopeptide (TPR) repeat protein
VAEPSHAVFLSYASEDGQAAQRICETLRAAGIEIWFDQSELRGGDAWDRSIRRQIKSCALFIPIISRNTHQRDEGYFRLEWKLAVDRCHLMAADRTFLLPVAIDDTRDDDERVPERFREVQWTRLPGGETPPAFVARVARLLEPATHESPTPRDEAIRVTAPTPPRKVAPASRWQRGLAILAAVALLGALGYLSIHRLWISKLAAAPAAASPPSAVFAPPPHSIAVLPFVNLSGDKDQEYFSEGLTEELLNSLTEIDGLQVSGRTSAFSFQGKDDDLGTIARKLNVGAILEGSVRRSGHTIRVTAKLINAVTGFEMWSESYDRDLGDVLKLQTEIATAVADSLKVALLSDVSTKIELGGTHSPAAFDAYLRGLKKSESLRDPLSDTSSAIAAYTQAIQLDPHYALAFAARSVALALYVQEGGTGSAGRAEGYQKAEADARRALALAPDLAQAHMALAHVLAFGKFDLAQATDEYERAVALAPGNAQVLRDSGDFTAYMGHFAASIAALRRAVVLDPLDLSDHTSLGNSLYLARRYGQAVAAYTEAISVDPGFKPIYGGRGFALLALGNLDGARASCETNRDYWVNQWCLAIVYDKLGRHVDADAEIAKLKAAEGDAAAYQYATIYAQRGDRTRALQWLDTTMRLRDPGLLGLKTDPLIDPLRAEPRFRAALRKLNFPAD